MYYLTFFGIMFMGICYGALEKSTGKWLAFAIGAMCLSVVVKELFLVLKDIVNKK